MAACYYVCVGVFVGVRVRLSVCQPLLTDTIKQSEPKNFIPFIGTRMRVGVGVAVQGMACVYPLGIIKHRRLSY